MFGFYNMALSVNVTLKCFDMKIVSDSVLRQTLGGKGLATYLLQTHNPAGVDPLGPDNHLIIASGPVAGTGIWGSCRHGLYAKSPQTGYYAESYSGGTVGDHIASTGFDAVMIHGASEEPIWLEVSEKTVHFHSAKNLWGKDTFQTEDSIKEWIKTNRPEAKNCGVLTIGPAGENAVSFSVVENDYWRSAGRTGIGAVMGSKKIKAIAFWGKCAKEVADPQAVKLFVHEIAKLAKDNPGVAAYKNLGTPMMVDIMSNVSSFPSRYWQKGTSEHRESINANALHTRCEVKPHACRKCFIACGRLSTIKEGRHKGLTIEGPEYETIYSFGGLCEIDSIEEISYLNDICDRLGLDTMSAGNLVGLTIEASRQKKIDYSIDYGQVDRIAELLGDIAYRRGIGDDLAKGIKSVAKLWNMEDQAIHVKGLEPAGYDPRILKGMGLAYGASDRGACHLRSTFYKPELSKMIDPEQISGKAAMFVDWEDRLTIFDTLVLCRFYRDLYQWEDLDRMIKGVTGLDLGADGLKTIAKSIADNTRRFNLQEGLTPEEDMLPKRFYTEVLPETGKVIREEQMRQLLDEYYKVRGWDETGNPPARSQP
ncbi:MAG: aldehyde ferredoxin oxidoreductase family protein [Pseudomonadota bacterium]